MSALKCNPEHLNDHSPAKSISNSYILLSVKDLFELEMQLEDPLHVSNSRKHEIPYQNYS
jgi:hypothetical protein